MDASHHIHRHRDGICGLAVDDVCPARLRHPPQVIHLQIQTFKGNRVYFSSIAGVLFEPQEWFIHHIIRYFPWLLFLAISEGLGFTLMALGQNYAPPTHAAIILSLEGVFAAVTSYFILGEILSHRELIGCALMLSATLIAEVGLGSIETKMISIWTSLVLILKKRLSFFHGHKNGHGNGHGHSNGGAKNGSANGSHVNHNHHLNAGSIIAGHDDLSATETAV